MKMSMLVTFYSSNYEHDPATFYQGCGSLKSQKDDLSNITKLVLSQVWWLDVAIYTLINSVQLLSCVQLFVTPCIAARQASLSITNSQSLLKLMSMERVMPSNHLICCRPLLLLPSAFPVDHQDLFQWVSFSHQVAKVLEFQLQHQSFQSMFRTDFL